jgi:hypothetical protein
MQGCFVANQFFVPEPEETIDLQTQAELNAAENTKASLKNEIYKPYGFSSLKIKKPIALLELEQLESELALSPGDTTLMRKVAEKKTYIKTRRIERTANFDHFFTLANDSTEMLSILEVNYSFNDTMAVKKMIPKIFLELPNSYELMIDYYFNEYTIFIAQTYAEGKKMSRTFYRFFKDQLETYETIERKSAFLKHTLEICRLVKLTGKFDQDFIVQSLFQTHLSEKRTDITDYDPLDFSDLYETKNNANDSIVGYYFFHKFSGNYADQKDTNVVLVEFSPHYEVGQIFQLENPFESYITKKK